MFGEVGVWSGGGWRVVRRGLVCGPAGVGVWSGGVCQGLRESCAVAIPEVSTYVHLRTADGDGAVGDTVE